MYFMYSVFLLCVFFKNHYLFSNLHLFQDKFLLRETNKVTSILDLSVTDSGFELVCCTLLFTPLCLVRLAFWSLKLHECKHMWSLAQVHECKRKWPQGPISERFIIPTQIKKGNMSNMTDTLTVHENKGCSDINSR